MEGRLTADASTSYYQQSTTANQLPDSIAAVGINADDFSVPIRFFLVHNWAQLDTSANANYKQVTNKLEHPRDNIRVTSSPRRRLVSN